MSVQSSTWPSDVRSSSLLRANSVLSWCCNHPEWSVKNKIEQNNYHQLPSISTLIKNSKNAKNFSEHTWRTGSHEMQKPVLSKSASPSSMSWRAENIFFCLSTPCHARYDTRRLMCCLVTTWCSQSSCSRAQRASVQPAGVSYLSIARTYSTR